MTTSEPDGQFEVVLLASDRMVTYRQREYELRDQTKAYYLSDRIIAMGAGDTEALLAMFVGTRTTMSSGTNRVEDAASTLAGEFQKYRLNRNERRVLSPFGMTFGDFLAKQRQLSPDFVERIEYELKGRQANLSAEVIVAGIDDLGASIYVIRDPGDTYPRNVTGFAAIGIGDQHAESVFTSAQYTRNRDWAEAQTVVYQAKKRAEAAPGVGEHTDLYWITPDGIRYWEPLCEFQEKLREIYENRRVNEDGALEEDTSLMLDWLQKANALPNDSKQPSRRRRAARASRRNGAKTKGR
ncbi:MAG: hypothetical protein HYY03_09150 [Chloroflexi bacterium]|nr:hypothetical protein [Chloroflexota bacterium]